MEMKWVRLPGDVYKRQTVSTPSKSDSDSVSNDTAATPTEPSKPDTSTEPSEPSNPTVPTKPEQPETPSKPELIDGKYKGLCYAEGYKKLLASGDVYKRQCCIVCM